MASLTQTIEEYIRQMLDSNESYSLSLRRKELAEKFGCVPSQINYVLSSRFTPERGFIVESQRGGHGYIKIVKVRYKEPEDRIKDLESLIGDAMDEQEARRLLAILEKRGLLTSRERLMSEVSLRYIIDLSDTLFDVSPYKRDKMLAELLKRIIRSLVLS
ncbi:MAG: CtsR family transcriptional regulator [Synergistales bacterium]|nr:CtsR family transcriptional regulator [Synergistales bacterium]